jgi:hypothetical protein
LFRHLVLQIGGANIANPPRFPTLAAELLRTAWRAERRLGRQHQGHRFVGIVGDRKRLEIGG